MLTQTHNFFDYHCCRCQPKCITVAKSGNFQPKKQQHNVAQTVSQEQVEHLSGKHVSPVGPNDARCVSTVRVMRVSYRAMNHFHDEPGASVAPQLLLLLGGERVRKRAKSSMSELTPLSR